MHDAPPKHRDRISVLGRDIPRGASLTLHIDVAALHTRNAVEAPVFVERAEEDGPVLLLMGGVHGDELNGIDIVRRIVYAGDHRPLRGTVICIPVLNIFGFINLNRKFPDGRDLNRVFPGSKSGSLASQFAYLFRTQVLPDIDYVLDFHTGGADRVNVAQTRCVLNDRTSFEVARAFGSPFVVQSRPIKQSIRDAFIKAGKTSIVFEGGRSMQYDEPAIAYGVLGAQRVMGHLGMTEPSGGIVDPPEEPIVVTKSRWVRAPASGMWHSLAPLGEYVERGTVLGTVSDPFGAFEMPVKAAWSGYVFCGNVAPVINKGDALFNASVEVRGSRAPSRV